MSQSADVLVYAVGDVLPDRPNPHESFDLVRADIRQADIAFCQLEGPISERGEKIPQARHSVRCGLKVAPALKDAGFTVVSFGGNHAMDLGPGAMFDTVQNLEANNLRVFGVGANIAEARKPVIVECKGSRVGYLAYCSILPLNTWAETHRPGCVPMRAWTVYEQVEHDQPGTPCRIRTFANREDLDALRADIAALRPQVDVLMVSIHWGIHFTHAELADYQREVGHAAIDAGADVILGHHAHILKGVEVYKGRPIFYSLCNFAIDLKMTQAFVDSPAFTEVQHLNRNWPVDLEGCYNFPADSSKTIVVKCVLRSGKLQRISILPTWVNRVAQPQILKADDPRFHQVVSYLQEISDHQGLGTRFVVDGSEVLVEATAA
jgi:poly-gamma-glutamate capsule biosynthesis protein CapA/YwtB (metallophosphatase superfamily)